MDGLIIRKVLDEAKIKVIRVKDKRLVAKLQTDFNIGNGEAEAIALALHEKALLLGIDDKDGINACKLLGISFTTAIGILVRSHEKRLIGHSDVLVALAMLARDGRYKNLIIEEARLKLKEQL